MWYQKFDTYILSFGFVRSKVDHCIYSKEEGGCFIYVVLVCRRHVVDWKQHECNKGDEEESISPS
jgi:hypothetical protein